MQTRVSKVSLFGVSRNALLFGRACALKDNPILGVYDPDPKRALQAALFLGVSARHTSKAIFADDPDVVICSLPNPRVSSAALLICLGAKPDSPLGPNICWADAGPTDDSIPDQISNELPTLRISLQGSDEAVDRAKTFLHSLSTNIIWT